MRDYTAELIQKILYLSQGTVTAWLRARSEIIEIAAKAEKQESEEWAQK